MESAACIIIVRAFYFLKGMFSQLCHWKRTGNVKDILVMVANITKYIISVVLRLYRSKPLYFLRHIDFQFFENINNFN